MSFVLCPETHWHLVTRLTSLLISFWRWNSSRRDHLCPLTSVVTTTYVGSRVSLHKAFAIYTFWLIELSHRTRSSTKILRRKRSEDPYLEPPSLGPKRKGKRPVDRSRKTQGLRPHSVPPPISNIKRPSGIRKLGKDPS